jgi:hypothetical protein
MMVSLMDYAFMPEVGSRALQLLWNEEQLEAVNEDTRDFIAATAEAADF